MQENNKYESHGVARSGIAPQVNSVDFVAVAVSLVSVLVGKIMKFLGMTRREDDEETSVITKLGKVKQIVTFLSSGMGVGCGMCSERDVGCTERGTGQEVAVEGKKVEPVSVGKGLEDMLAPNIGGPGHGNEAHFLDDEGFLNELIRDPRDVEFVKKLIGRHRQDDMKEAISDLTKGLAETAVVDKDSAIKEEEVLTRNGHLIY